MRKINHPSEIILSRLRSSQKNDPLEEDNEAVAKSEYINRNEYYDWPLVIATTCAGTLVTLAPFLPAGYFLEKNDYKKGNPRNKSIIKSSYIPAICLSLCVGIGLNNVNTKANKKTIQYR